MMRFLASDADINASTDAGATVLILAARESNLFCVDALLNRQDATTNINATGEPKAIRRYIRQPCRDMPTS